MDLERFFFIISYKQIEEFQNSWSRASDDFEKRWSLHTSLISKFQSWRSYKGNPQVTGGFPSQRLVTWTFDVFLWYAPEQRVEQTIKTLSHSLWHQCNDKQRVLMHGHQGWNVRHGLCHIYMIYVYIWVVYSFCLFCCLFIIVTTQFVALYKPCKPKPKFR